MSPNETKRFVAPEPVAEQTKTLSETLLAPVRVEKQDSPQVERRAFARRKGKGKVTYQIGDSPMAVSYKAAVVDISQSGIGLITHEFLAVGTQLRVVGDMPYRGQKVCRWGSVRWVQTLAENQFRIGISLEKRLQYTEMQSFLN